MVFPVAAYVQQVLKGEPMSRASSNLVCLMTLCCVALSACGASNPSPAAAGDRWAHRLQLAVPCHACRCYSSARQVARLERRVGCNFCAAEARRRAARTTGADARLRKAVGPVSSLEQKQEGPELRVRSASCILPGLPQSMTEPYPIVSVPLPGRVTILIETYGLTRRIYTDGSPLPVKVGSFLSGQFGPASGTATRWWSKPLTSAEQPAQWNQRAQ